jgi:hypothetical protein
LNGFPRYGIHRGLFCSDPIPGSRRDHRVTPLGSKASGSR